MNDTTHPIDRYLDDLARMLTTLPPAERADALGSVREHVDDALADLGRPATPEDVTAILARLGSPATVAAALLDDAAPAPAPADSPAYVAPQPAPAAEPLPGDSDAAVSLGLSILALLVPFVGIIAAIAAIVLARRSRRRGTRREGVRTTGLTLGIVALAGQLMIIAGLVSLLAARTTYSETDGSRTVVESVVPAP